MVKTNDTKHIIISQSQQVFMRLKKCMSCLSPSVTIRLMNRLGQGHNHPVQVWQDELIPTIYQPSLNMILFLFYTIASLY